MLKVLRALLAGKKTYLVGGITIIVTGAYGAGYIREDMYKLLLSVLGGLGLMTLRAAVAKNGLNAILVALLLAGCAGPFGLTGSPEQLKELIKVKDAAVTCVKGVYAGMTVTATAGSIDKGIYGGTVTVDENCKMTVGTGPWVPGQPVSPPTVKP